MSTRYILSDKCTTCIFRPGNLMHLSAGQLAGLNASCDREDTNVICHQSPSVGAGELSADAYCAGSFERRPGQHARILGRLLGDDAFVTPAELTKETTHG